MDLSFLENKTCVLYGATSGIGAELVRGIARSGCRKIWLICRDEQKGKTLAYDLLPLPVEVVIADGSSMDELQQAGQYIAERTAIQVLMLNAAVITKGKTPTKDKYNLEKGFAVNYLSYAKLASALLPAMDPDSRIVITSSQAGSTLNWKVDWTKISMTAKGDHEIESMNEAFMQYAQCKVLLVMFCVELANRLRSRCITVNAFHPGAVNTAIGNAAYPCVGPCFKGLLSYFVRKPQDGAILGLYLAGAPQIKFTGCYFTSGMIGRVTNFKPTKLTGDCADEKARAKLWELTEKWLKEPVIPTM